MAHGDTELSQANKFFAIKANWIGENTTPINNCDSLVTGQEDFVCIIRQSIELPDLNLKQLTRPKVTICYVIKSGDKFQRNGQTEITDRVHPFEPW